MFLFGVDCTFIYLLSICAGVPILSVAPASGDGCFATCPACWTAWKGLDRKPAIPPPPSVQWVSRRAGEAVVRPLQPSPPYGSPDLSLDSTQTRLSNITLQSACRLKRLGLKIGKSMWQHTAAHMVKSYTVGDFKDVAKVLKAPMQIAPLNDKTGS